MAEVLLCPLGVWRCSWLWGARVTPGTVRTHCRVFPFPPQGTEQRGQRIRWATGGQPPEARQQQWRRRQEPPKPAGQALEDG